MAFPKLVQSDSIDDGPMMTQERFKELLGGLENNVSEVVVVSQERLRFLLLALVCQGHVLLEDSPGVGKTLIAKTLAQSIDGEFARVQCTPDLLPSDITGTSIFNVQDSRFEFKPGPVFANILLADEINRTGPRTQSALLEAMAENQVSADGRMYRLPAPFLVVATQNSMESHGVFPLPDSQRDRFLVRMSLGLPTLDQEVEILARTGRGMPSLSPVVTTKDVNEMQEYVASVDVADSVRQYMVRLARATREHTYLSRGVSLRGTVLLQRACQGWAAMDGRTYVVPEDVKDVAPMVLPHRVTLRGANQTDATQFV
ncbi:MAG: MoxR family ATPase [SAR202 cluster bacterium]|nr:MoxR family ATPase [SAR202 cluster bacterium]|tara:strand:- start:7420 stop:8364 length:945 start_codon:yes stop_codon:yes gene_type:complete